MAIIAHVDHGKTTLVDVILKQTDFFRSNQQVADCFLDSNDLERERGITILSKNISVNYNGVKINIIDTPGHSDFGGQVERVLNLADGVLLLVDAAEGPMPQTRFVLDKALSLGLKPVVVINKIDKPDARPGVVLDKIFDLFIELDANDEQLEFPVLYASGKDGWAALEADGGSDVSPLLDAIINDIPAPEMREGPLQMQIASLDYSDFVGRIGIGRVYRGNFASETPVVLIKRNGASNPIPATKRLFTFDGLERVPAEAVSCGDICAVVGVENIDISDTIAAAGKAEALPPIALDEPTVSMVFRVNDSPLYGKEGKFVSSRHLRERLLKEAERDTALEVEETGSDDFVVKGRGVLHFSILIENMRREGYEMSVSRPHVIFKEIDGRRHEPVESLSVDVPNESAGRVIEMVGLRRGEMTNMEQRGERRLVEFEIPTRGLIGLRGKILTATAGEAVFSHRFLKYAPFKGAVPHRQNGVLVSMGAGKSVAYAIDGLQQRGIFFINPGDTTYEGMIVGENNKDDDLTVNLQKGKQLTNIRSAGSDRNMKIAPPRTMSLEDALEYIDEDELVEATPRSIRLRKRFLTELERKRARGGRSRGGDR